MKALLFAVCTGAVVVTSAGPTAAADDKDIVDLAAGSKEHTIFVTAVKEAGLVEVLKGKGPFTVFAPTDAAFKKLGEDKIRAVVKDKALLTKLLLAHVVPGKAVYAADAVRMDGQDVNGFKVGVSGKTVTIGEAKVTAVDRKATNGVIHVIDTVLIPKQ